MSRPLYETPDDLARESDVAMRLGEKWKCEVLKLPKLWPLDYCGVRGKQVEAWIEIKCRNYNFEQLSQLGGIIISAQKVIGWKDLIDITQKPVFLAARLTDGIYTMRYAPLVPYETRIAGRTDRNDEADTEPCVVFPMPNFRKL